MKIIKKNNYESQSPQSVPDDPIGLVGEIVFVEFGSKFPI